MNDEAFSIAARPRPTAEQPLRGLTVLLVEDSRFASEAVHLLCLRSGARMRRADSLAAAHRHLAVYRPTVVIADLGLPDGSGAELIAELAGAAPRVPVILGTSGDPDAGAAALSAGADGFLAKPVESLAGFQQEILARLPADLAPRGPRLLRDATVVPDAEALRADLTHAAELVGAKGQTGEAMDYAAQCLAPVACAAHDPDLEAAARGLTAPARKQDIARVTAALATRLRGTRAS